MTSHTPSMFPDLVPDATKSPYRDKGVLPFQTIREYIENGIVRAALPIVESQIQPASLDLRLGQIAYQVKASFLPGENTVAQQLRELTVAKLDLTKPQVLQKDCVYIVPVAEEISLPSDVMAKANPKSSIGRIDLFTRLITDGATEFDRVPRRYQGPLYVEVAPRSFSVQLLAGASLNQIRFVKGYAPPSDRSLMTLEAVHTLVFGEEEAEAKAQINAGLWFSVDLLGDADGAVVGFRALRRAPVVDLSTTSLLDPTEYWEPVPRPQNDYLILEPGEFYILGSKEQVRVPADYAAEMVSYDPSVGEFRVHYAGFFDPGFGYGDNDILGTRAVLEVRSHEVPFLLRHRQRVGRLLYERLTEPAQKVYGAAGVGSSYQRQGLRLSRYFADWPR